MERGSQRHRRRRGPLTCHNSCCDSGGLAAGRRAITDRAQANAFACFKATSLATRSDLGRRPGRSSQ